MHPKKLRELYFKFFQSKGHQLIESASLIPQNDASVLFNTAGMQPLVPFFLGQTHPSGKRIVNVQKCLRTVDFENIGDNSHHTFFQMLGNWSLGDYFKEEAIDMSFEFLTKILKLPLDMLAFTCYKGSKGVSKDTEAAKKWKSLGIPDERIVFLTKDNFWSAGETGPCGPSSEMFYWTGKKPAPKKFDPNDDTWVEIWNDVFMCLEKNKDGSISELKQKNVDTGMGLERTVAVLQGKESAYETELFQPVVKKIEQLSKKSYRDHQKEMRIIADHIRAAVFVLGDENAITPSNVDRGYILRRLIRRAVRYGKMLDIQKPFLSDLARLVVKDYGDYYKEIEKNKLFIFQELDQEEQKFALTLEKGLREFQKIAVNSDVISGKDAFLLFQSYGFPLEMTQELAAEQNISVDEAIFKEEFEKHQSTSRTAAAGKFKGGLADDSPETTQLHTATHLLLEVLRRVVDSNIKQRGSNITPERLRFDFSFDRKLTDEEKKKVEDEMNRIIDAGMEVRREEMSKEEAVTLGAQMEFGAKYPERVSVYFIGDFSKEFCGGPHVKNTSELGKFKIKKEQSSSAGVRRIKAVLLKE
ncbi:alanine--tRNA ligase [Candidatus Woesearchaeota archaeon]|jgi:alanyl-tRNA synthetase|nr:alanine--tRNA ligase [Candidatus Woesearchaeota archaeon]MBT4150402.1 alanine--tRNA ligase [Candidatus Woesearchaeota archaeon]MBT4247402.1 alanine--tRNA ligase [Candidatus Woesearchaeota archaeon]MBT4434543.1 alanine--tRNA ligase [Candidatus Woesearchaeota archaeon]MBT7331711.1 alanine--tRNA ligase [Candidatus Woesearchaeota archaeon]